MQHAEIKGPFAAYAAHYVNLYSPKNGNNTKTRTSININKTKATTKYIKSNDTLY